MERFGEIFGAATSWARTGTIHLAKQESNKNQARKTCLNQSFTAYNNTTFAPTCKAANEDEHSYHRSGQPVVNTTNDLLIGIWGILKHQAKWLEEKMEEKEGTTQTQGAGLPQADLDKLINETTSAVNRASRRIEKQNNELMERFINLRKDIVKAAGVENLDDRFKGIKQVIENGLADMDEKISELQRSGRNILNELVDVSGGSTKVEKLVQENNSILKDLQQGKMILPGFELLAKKEDVEELGKQIDPPTLVRKTDLVGGSQAFPNINVITDAIRNENRGLEDILKEISKKLDDLSTNKSVAKELEKAQQHLDNMSQLLGLSPDYKP
ncbi:hypothetical protein Tsubulata_043364 [Turnera subulata]|uniref:Uncharacterized protein n=1 Tax=Turnera subulata TaxID=218843 RepID=A0A9Q0EZM6_9ROSI|nr:hypothetical protein Tsubulata_043364 [Turnera subulata]